jgi:DNA-binding response OmpR family regulator
MLLVQDDPVFCDNMRDYLQSPVLVEFEHAPTGKLGARMIASGRFDIALINATLTDMPGIELAARAANENLAVLMLSDNWRISEELARLGYRFLEVPCLFDTLLAEAKRLMQEHADYMTRLRSSTAVAEASLQALRAEVAEAHRRFDTIVGHLGYLRR